MNVVRTKRMRSLHVLMIAILVISLAFIPNQIEKADAATSIAPLQSVVTYNGANYLLINSKVYKMETTGQATLLLSDVDTFVGSDDAAVALKKDGTVWALAKDGQYVGKPTGAISTFTQLAISDVSNIWVNNMSVRYLKKDGTLFASGFNTAGSLGVGNTNYWIGYIAPVIDASYGQLQNVVDFFQLGTAISYVRTKDKLYAYGDNVRGLLGNTSVAVNGNTVTPVQVLGLPDLTGKTVKLSYASETIVAQIGTETYYWGRDPFSASYASNQTSARKATLAIGELNSYSVSYIDPVKYASNKDMSTAREQFHFDSLMGGALYNFGVTIANFKDPVALPGTSPYTATPVSRLTNVVKYVPVGEYSIALKTDKSLWYVRDADVQKINGPTGEINNVKDIVTAPLQFQSKRFSQEVYSSGSTTSYVWRALSYQLPMWILKDNGDLWANAFSMNSAEVKIPVTGVQSLVQGGYSMYAQTDSGDVYDVSYIYSYSNPTNNYKSVKITGLDTVQVVLETPILTQTLDKFSNHILSVDYGSSADIATKEYSVDGGTTWLAYTAPVKLTGKTTVSFKARSGAAGGIYSALLESTIVNDPIIIAAGYPRIVDAGNGNVSIESGTTHPDVKVEIRIDGGSWQTYTGPVLLPAGGHSVETRVSNLSGDVLGSDSKSVNGPTPAPTATPIPTVAPTATPAPTVAPTATPVPTVAPTATPVPTVAPTATPVPTVAPTATPVPTVAPTATPQPTIDPGWGSPIGSEDISFTVLGGGFSSQFNGLMLDTVTIGTTNQYQVLNSVTNSVIEDSRGTGAGWNYSLKITDFVSDPVIDNSLGTSSLIVKMPSTVLSVDVTDTTTLAGQNMKLGLNGTYVFNAEPVVLAKAEAFQGMGQYQLPMSYMLRVPDKVEIVSAGSGSTYQAGAKTGLRVGTYRSQFTFTLASGI
ncbi:hypothetical protein [Paenibacillus phytohabitans]|uniref:hypothetical protein n=1 Tax=Paenibacillus phytohabitans TaxID=2654978 RepID=UPI001C11EA3E|nr:hypothetical protein [Paenibacillus phytohabitans]